MAEKVREYKYRFIPDDGTEITYAVKVDEDSLNVIYENEGELPEWTQLNNNQCEHCPLSKEDVSHCPVARNIFKLITTFDGVKSFSTAKVIVESPERIFTKNTDIQNGLGSLFGLVMASSACPSMSFLKPMARFHLPFASTEESLFRSLGSFLIRLYLKGDISKAELTDQLTEKYEDVNSVNKHLIDRLDHLFKRKNTGDADRNAIVILDSLAMILTFEIDNDDNCLTNLYKE